MQNRDARVDAYIERSADFARPILESLREQIHAACAQVEETIKWGFPHFVLAGSTLCYMASFKQHAALGFRKAELLDGIPRGKEGEAMGQFGRLIAVSDLPSRRALAALIKQAARLNKDGISPPASSKRKPASSSRLPIELANALSSSNDARQTYENFPPGEQREYRDWVAEAKQESTRKRRATQAAEWLAEGKKRNWKYSARSR